MKLIEVFRLSENEELEGVNRKIQYHVDQLIKYRRRKAELSDRIRRKSDNERERSQKRRDRERKVRERNRMLLKRKDDRSSGSEHGETIN
jgi:uncharacterized protein YjcR